MKRWVRIASCLYPAAWRRRYATEFDAMLDQVDADWKDVFDTLEGALIMQFSSWNLKTITIAFALGGAMVAAAVAFNIPNVYSSTSALHITTGSEPPNEVTALLNRAQTEVLSRTSLRDIVARNGLYQSQPIDEAVEKMRSRDIHVREIRTGQTGHSAAFLIETTYSDPNLAQTFNRELVTKFTRALPRAGALTSLELLDSPSWPGQPIYPRRWYYSFVFAGLFAGLTIGLIVSYCLRWRIAIVRKPPLIGL